MSNATQVFVKEVQIRVPADIRPHLENRKLQYVEAANRDRQQPSLNVVEELCIMALRVPIPATAELLVKKFGKSAATAFQNLVSGRLQLILQALPVVVNLWYLLHFCHLTWTLHKKLEKLTTLRQTFDANVKDHFRALRGQYLVLASLLDKNDADSCVKDLKNKEDITRVIKQIETKVEAVLDEVKAVNQVIVDMKLVSGDLDGVISKIWKFGGFVVAGLSGLALAIVSPAALVTIGCLGLATAAVQVKAKYVMDEVKKEAQLLSQDANNVRGRVCGTIKTHIELFNEAVVPVKIIRDECAKVLEVLNQYL